jgi:PAS domain S-box-containing protein
MSANATKVGAVAQPGVHWKFEEAYELATILDSVLDTARALIPADAYAIWLLESGQEEWSIAAGRGLSMDFTAPIPGGPDAMPATPICAEHVEREEMLSHRLEAYRREGIRSLMAVPILFQEQRRGTLVFYFRNPHSFSAGEIQHAKTLARLSSSALAATELYREQSLAKAHSDFLVEQVQRREQEARTLLENLPDVISRFDRNFRHLYVSPHVERLTGMPAAASLGKTFEELGYPAHLCELWNGSLRRVFAEGAAHSVEFSYQGHDGQTRHFVATGVPEITRDGVVESVMTFSRDITEQRDTVHQLKASQTQLRLIIDSVPGLVAYVDTEERLRRVNRTFEEWFQRPMKSLLGLSIREITGENYAHLAPRVAQALAGQEVQFEATNRYPDATRDVLITYVPDIDDNGKVCGFVALVIDLTERRKAEDAMRRTEKLAAAGRLAASIAHEINNPLESVTNLIYLLNQDPSLSSVSREYLTLAEQELTRVSQIATQTLRFHRQSSRAVSVRVQELLDAIYALYHSRFDRLGIVLERRYRDGKIITAFEGELRQLFANLIANALDAMPNGGRLVLRTRHVVRADGVGGIQVTVADTGQGIATELRGRIFEPFVTSKGMTGTGLGLWVSKEIVQKHRGSIRVRSRSDGAWRGTVFVVFLAETPSGAANEA